MLNIAAIQYDIVWEDPNANRDLLDPLIAEFGSSDVIILPEMFNTGFSINEKLSESTDGPTLRWMQNLAKKYDCAICGSISTKLDAYYVNRFYWVDQNGTQHYDKKHLFGYGKEGEIFSPGDQHLVVEYKGWRIMPLICYDLRFPVWSRNTKNYDLLLYVANWPDTRASAWRQLLRARAIENLCYVCGVNRIGVDGVGLNYIGDTSLIDYMGEDIKILKDEAATLQVVIDKEEMIKFRTKFGFLEDRDKFTLD